MRRRRDGPPPTCGDGLVYGTPTALPGLMSRKSLVSMIGWIALTCFVSAQTNPTPQPLPYSQNFGANTFTVLPAGMAAWNGLNGGSVDTSAKAALSVPNGDATLSIATAATTGGGSFGYASGGNARFYVQSSSNATNGANQLAIALDTSGQSNISLQYDIEIVSAQPRTIGVLCQYRVGNTGAWTTLTTSSGTNPFSQAAGTIGVKTSPVIPLPSAAENKPVVQIRWAFWRGAESGNSSGAAIDNLSVTGTQTGNSLSIAVVPSTIHENDGAGAALVTVTTASPVATDLAVTLNVSDATEAAVDGPNPAIIPAGQSSATFSIRAVDDLLLDGTQSVSLQATAASTAGASALLTVLDNEDAYTPPAAYYTAAEGLSGAALKGALKTIITAGHVQYSYSGTLTPLRAIYEDPANPTNLLTVYSGTSLGKFSSYYSGANPDTTWSREHVWPASFGLDTANVDPGFTDADAGADYTDLFNLKPALQTVNGARGNLYYDQSTGTLTVPPLAPLCSKDSNSWEPRDVEKGDLARTILYMATRYDGTDPNTIDLEVGNSPNPVTGVFANLPTLLKWHEDDPVSTEERQRNQLIYSNYQHNRNPFIDHPEYVALIWGSVRVSKLAAAVTEGGISDSYTLVLTSQPTANVTINTTSTPVSQVIATPASVTFTSTNWNLPQTIILSAVNDSVYETTLTATVQHSISTPDTNYASLTPSTISVTVTDNDPIIAAIPLPISYGGPWSPLPTLGYLGSGLETYATSLGVDAGSGSVKFAQANDQLTIAFDRSPALLTYRLKGNPTSGTATSGTFLIEQSQDGITFRPVRTVIDKDNTDQGYTEPLSVNTRFVSFLYQARAGGNIQLDMLSVTAASWSIWQSSYGLSGQNADPQTDYDKDGLGNLAEYALGGSPLVSDSPSVSPQLEKLPTKTRLTAIIRTGDAGLISAAETTTDPANPNSWSTSGIQKISPVSQTGVSAGFERMTFEINDSASPRRFVRLRFHLN
ncbi:MAG: endonuclease [Luteolibacter sp.]